MAIAIVVLIVGAAVFAVLNLKPAVQGRELLSRVGVPDEMHAEILNRVYWKDPLKYTSGFEVVAAGVDPELWTTPAGWSRGEITMDDFFAMQEVEISKSAFERLELDGLPTVYHEWYFCETGRDAEDFKDWEYVVGLYNRAGRLLVYRGHDLNGDLILQMEGCL